MRSRLLAAFMLPIAVTCALAQVASSQHRISARQARQMVVLVARHENIDLSDTHVELNSMDLGREFIPGFVSFIVIRESTTPGPDETLRRYTVNRRSGDVWEINLCTHYEFPELTRMRKAYALDAAPSAGDVAAEGKELGCTETKAASTL
jgi:Effector immunity protein Tgi2PP